jgi:hypothetical protein
MERCAQMLAAGLSRETIGQELAITPITVRRWSHHPLVVDAVRRDLDAYLGGEVITLAIHTLVGIVRSGNEFAQIQAAAKLLEIAGMTADTRTQTQVTVQLVGGVPVLGEAQVEVVGDVR